MRKHLVTVSMLVIGLAVFTSCIDNKDQNTVTEAKLIVEIENAYQTTKQQCLLDFTSIIQKHIPIGSAKEDVVRILEKNGFEIAIIPKEEGIEFLRGSRLHEKNFIIKVSFLIFIDFSQGKARDVRGKVYCIGP